MFGGTIKNPGQPDDGHFAYSPKAYFLIGNLDHQLPNPAYLPCDVYVELTLNSPEVCFTSKTDADNDINFDFEKARLFVRNTKLNEKLFLQIESKLKNEAIRQYFTSTHINTYSIPSGCKKEEFDSIASGHSPSRIICMFSETDRYLGKFDKNCFNFPRKFSKANGNGEFLIQSVKCYLKAEEVDRLNCDDSLHSFRDQYFRMFQLLRQSDGRNACSITFEDFWKNTLVFIFDLTASMGATDYPMLPLVREGHLRISCKFTNPSSVAMTMVTLVDVPSAITIEGNGKTTLSSI